MASQDGSRSSLFTLSMPPVQSLTSPGYCRPVIYKARQQMEGPWSTGTSYLTRRPATSALFFMQ